MKSTKIKPLGSGPPTIPEQGLQPPTIYEHKVGQAPCTVFQGFCMTWPVFPLRNFYTEQVTITPPLIIPADCGLATSHGHWDGQLYNLDGS